MIGTNEQVTVGRFCLPITFSQTILFNRLPYDTVYLPKTHRMTHLPTDLCLKVLLVTLVFFLIVQNANALQVQLQTTSADGGRITDSGLNRPYCKAAIRQGAFNFFFIFIFMLVEVILQSITNQGLHSVPKDMNIINVIKIVFSIGGF